MPTSAFSNALPKQKLESCVQSAQDLRQPASTYDGLEMLQIIARAGLLTVPLDLNKNDVHLARCLCHSKRSEESERRDINSITASNP